MPIIARNMKWVIELAFVPPKLEKVLSGIWPGPTTVILPKKEIIPSIVTAKKKNVGIRIPDCVLTDKLLGRFGYPLTATSANISGEEATGDINKIIEMFRNEIVETGFDSGCRRFTSVGAINRFGPYHHQAKNCPRGANKTRTIDETSREFKR